MTKFPVLSSILATEHLASWIREKYDIVPNTTCKVLRMGINHSYLISSKQEKYVFRIYSYKWRTETEIREELRFINLLKANNISVSYPIADKNGEFIQTIDAPEGQRFAVLFSFAHGDSIRNPNEAICHEMGRIMAKIHAITIDHKLDKKTYNSEELVEWAYQSARQHFPESLAEMRFIRNANKEIKSLFEKANHDQLRSGIVHLDLWHDNIKINNHSEITIFDFDNCGNGWLFLDIAYTIMLFHNNEPDKTVFERKLSSFYDGYQRVTAISEEEKRLVPYGGLAIWIHYAGIHAQRFDNWSNVFLSEDFLKYWISTVKKWLDYNHISMND